MANCVAFYNEVNKGGKKRRKRLTTEKTVLED